MCAAERKDNGSALLAGGNEETPIANPKQPTSACGAPLWMKMVAARPVCRSLATGDRVEADDYAVARDPDKQPGPRCLEAPFFVALGNGEHAWQCLERTCSVTVTSCMRGYFHGRDWIEAIWAQLSARQEHGTNRHVVGRDDDRGEDRTAQHGPGGSDGHRSRRAPRRT